MAIYLPGVGLPRYLQEGFTLTLGDIITNRLTRSNPHRATTHSPPYVDCSGILHRGTAQQWFKWICNAWDAGGGYPWARTAKGFVTIDKPAWHNMAASFQWYLGNGRYATYNGFQWYCGYNLAALSANSREFYFPLSGRDTDLVCFTAAPDGVYTPTEIASVNVGYWYDPATIPPGQQVLIANINPMLVGERVPGFPHTPSTAPVLCHSQTPPRGSNFAPRRRPFFFVYGYAFYNEFTVGYPPGPALQNFSDTTCIPGAACWHQFFYTRVNSPYSYYTFQDDPIHCQEPGPPITCFGPVRWDS